MQRSHVVLLQVGSLIFLHLLPHWSLLHTTNSLLQSFAISSQSTTLSLIPLHIPSFHSPSPHSATHPSFCYPSPHSATHPLILLPIPSFCYPSPHSATHPLILLPIPSFCYPSPHSATHPLILLPIPSFCYPSPHSATHPLILLPIPSFCYPSPHSATHSLIPMQSSPEVEGQTKAGHTSIPDLEAAGFGQVLEHRQGLHLPA